MNLIRRFLLAAALLLGAALPAPAAILFAGGEDVNVYGFYGDGGVTTSGGGTTYDSNFAREALGVSYSNGGGTTPVDHILLGTFTAEAVIWFHAEVNAGQVQTNNNVPYVTVYGSDGVRRLQVMGTGTNGQVKITKRTAAGSGTDLVTCTIGGWPLSALGKLDLYVNYASSGEVTLYYNGVQLCDYQGNVTTDSATAVNQIDLSTAEQGGATTTWSELIVSTTDTRNLRLRTLAPTANGTNMAWTGAYTNVNPTTINDASFIYTGSNSQVAEFTTGALPSGTAWTVVALSQTARLLVGATGPSTASFILRPATGSTDYPLCAGTAPITSFANYSCITALNPASSAAWAPADLGTGFNAGVESTP